MIGYATSVKVGQFLLDHTLTINSVEEKYYKKLAKLFNMTQN